MKNEIAAGLGVLLLGAVWVAAPASFSIAKEDRCADARRTCIAWCEEHRGPDGNCQADCQKRYKKCKRTGFFIWGWLAPDTKSARC